MELRQLEYFVAVAERLHFGRAAEALSIGQPAVSQQVAKLERELGVTLLDRTPRHVALTGSGSAFLPAARAVLATAELARVRATESRDGAPTTLRIGTSHGLGERLTAVLATLRELSPRSSVELVAVPTRARLERVAAGQLDAAFVRGTWPAPGLDLVEVWSDQLLVVLPGTGELAGRTEIDLAELADLPLRIVPRRQNPPMFDRVMEACAAAGFVPTVASRPDPVEDLLAAVMSGPPSWTLLYEPHARMLAPRGVTFLPASPPLLMSTAVAVRETETSRAVIALLRACAAAADQAIEALTGRGREAG